MWRDAPFKICLILSTFIHLTFLYPWSFLEVTPSAKITFQKLELTYFKVGETEDVLVKDIKPITSIKEKSEKEDTKTKRLEKIKIDLKRDAESKIEEEKTKEEKPEIAKVPQRETDAKESDSEDETLRDSYYLEVREKIKAALEKNGRRFMKEGDVYVRFIVKRDGTLKDLILYKKSGKNMRVLEEIAIKSIKEASPFPAFDESMKEAELPFDLPIRFSLHR